MRYLILGATEVLGPQGRPVPLGGRRLRALLTALALRAGSDAPVPVDVLIDEVWPDPDALPGDATAALQALVGRLRRTLGRDAVRSQPGGYRLEAGPDDVDLLRFQRLARDGGAALDGGDPAAAAALLREALALWRGPALADLPDRASAAGHPDALRHTVLQRRIAADLALGHAERVLPELRALAARHPLDEPLGALLLKALRATGRTAEALQAYETVRRATADRLGTDPGGELRALHATLLAETAADTPTDRSASPAPAPEPAPRTPLGNLRARLNSFVGREADLATLHADLERHRLVTLTGPGGSGKTRLAERAASDALDGPTGFPDGAWLVELAPLDHPAAVPGAVLSALGRRTTSLFPTAIDSPRATPHDHTVDAAERLLELCARRRMLIVLDNCEHLIEAAATLTATLLAHCPGLTVLATSREPLGVPGETARPVEPLPPTPAHRLFAERGAEVRPGFRPDAGPRDAAAVTEICRRLDGLPLAIELAAARLRSLTPAQIAERLDDRFRLLTTGSRTVLPRQQTLRAVVDWSWDLLDADERTVLRRVSVFAGGCTLSAAEHVCAGPGPEDGDDRAAGPDVMNALGALVDKSLLVADTTTAAEHTGVRYRMLETIHAYARERAAEHPEDRARAEARHTEQILRFVTAAEPRLRSAEQLAWLPRVEADLDNIRSAAHRAVRDGDADSLVTLVRGMGWFWWLRNYRDEGARWIARALALMDPAAVRTRSFRLLRYFLLHEQHGQQQLRHPEARKAATEIVRTFRTPHPEGAVFPGLMWPFAAFITEGPAAVCALMDSSVANCRTRGGPWELGAALLFRAHLAFDTLGGTDRVTADSTEVDALAEATGDRWLLSQACGLRAELATARGRYAHARTEYETALGHAEALGAHTELPFLRARIAETHYREGDTAKADELAALAVEESDRLGVADALFYGTFLRTVVALEHGDAARARSLFAETEEYALKGTPPSMLEAAMLALRSRITTLEGARPLDAVRLARDALLRSEQTDSPEVLRASALLAGADAALALGHPDVAVRLADAARAIRGTLQASVPEQREDHRIRDAAARAGARGRHPGDEGALTVAQAAALLDTLAPVESGTVSGS